MILRQNDSENWYLDFGKKKIDICIGDRILVCFCDEWLSILIKEIKFNNDGCYLLVDDGLEKEHISLYSCQWISDARN